MKLVECTLSVLYSARMRATIPGHWLALMIRRWLRLLRPLLTFSAFQDFRVVNGMANNKQDDDAGQNKARKRSYGDFFAWPHNRQLEEWAIVDLLKESLEKANAGFFHGVIARGQGNDPPDCEAVLQDGGKLGIEVTELVDTEAIMAHMNGNTQHTAQWDEDKLITAVNKRLQIKDASKNIKGGPYETYILLIHTDEPQLSYDYVNPIIEGYKFSVAGLIDRAFLLMSYDEKYQSCPYIELTLSAF